LQGIGYNAFLTPLIMKKINVIFLSVLILFLLVPGFSAQVKIKAPGVNWEKVYSFDRCNSFEVLFYRKTSELVKKIEYKTWYQTNGKDFSVKLLDMSGNYELETVFDLKNEVAIQIWKTGAKPYYNAGGFKYPTEKEIKQLLLVPTEDSKMILGYNCKKYTYQYKKIFGEVWLTTEIQLSNDVGIFRAAKMSALHNTLSVGGFVMEMTTEDSKGGKTVMTTKALQEVEKKVVNFEGVDMNTAINKVNYYTF